MFRHSSLLVIHASQLGHTRRIACWLGEAWGRVGIQADVVAVSDAERLDLTPYSAVVVVTSVHRGKPSRAMVRWLGGHRDELAARPLVLVSVSLTAAAKDPQSRRTVEGYAAALASAAGATPALCDHVAGALQYTRYGRLTKRIVQRIARERGLPTDTAQDAELTDWTELGEFASLVVDLLDRTPLTPNHAAGQTP